MRSQDIQRLVERYRTFARLPVSNGLSGCILETFGHVHFQKQIIIDYAQMVRLTRNGGKDQPKWHSRLPLRDESHQESERQDALDLVKLRPLGAVAQLLMCAPLTPTNIVTKNFGHLTPGHLLHTEGDK
jgi:hypothetical protein